MMGRDHTISALAKGYVRYYRDPERHAKRKFIGVVFGQDEVLPRGRNMSRKRRLGMVPRVVKAAAKEDGGVSGGGVKKGVLRAVFSDGYQYRPSNTEIGRAAKDSGIEYPVYRRGQRWLAWRLRIARRKRTVERLAIRKRTGGNMGKKDKAKTRTLKRKVARRAVAESAQIVV